MALIKKYQIFSEINQLVYNTITLFLVTKRMLLFVTLDNILYQCKIKGKQNNKAYSFSKEQMIVKLECSNAKNAIHFVALIDDGSVYAWGNNNRGQLGNGTTKDCDYPTLIDSMSGYNVIDICCGLQYTLLLTNNGFVFGFGDNRYGQCGRGVYYNQILPYKLNILNTSKFVKISCGDYHSLALTENGEIFGWGTNYSGQLGFQTLSKQFSPRPLNFSAIKQTACGHNHTFLLTIDGDIHFLGTYLSNIRATLPRKLNNSTKFKNIAGSLHSELIVALSTDNNCYIIGTYTTYYGSKAVVNFLKKTEFTSIEKTIAFYDQITYSSIFTDEKKLTNTLNNFDCRFEKVCLLGEGGFSKVYKYRNIRNNKQYAIKVISFCSQNARKIFQELIFLSDLKSEFVVTFFDHWVEESKVQNNMKVLHIQMELCSITLRDAINLIKKTFITNNLLSLIGYYISSELFYEILECVHYLHSHDPIVIHRDIKPENILLSNFGDNRFVKLSDFGLSTFHKSDDQSHTKYTGTKNYRAPELNFSTKYTPKIDMFSLGIVFKEMLSIDLNALEQDYNPELIDKMNYSTKLIEKLLSSVPETRPNCKQLINDSYLWRLADKQLVSDKIYRSILANPIKSFDECFVECFIQTRYRNPKIIPYNKRSIIFSYLTVYNLFAVSIMLFPALILYTLRNK